MTREEAKRLLEKVAAHCSKIRAFAEGADIEHLETVFQGGPKWVSNPEPEFLLGVDYRIKPKEPRKFYLVLNSHGRVIAGCPDKERADELSRNYPSATVVPATEDI